MAREIRVYQDLMGANDRWAAKTRALLAERGLAMLNLIGSAGSGKTALLEASIPRLAGRVRIGVLEGDIATTHDAERIHRLGAPVSQLLSGGSCHLEAKLVHHALRDLPLAELDLVVVENVGNLVCPAEFDVGETAKVAVLSITEGEDKPAKYPLLFSTARAVVLSKTDLLPHLRFDLPACQRYVRQVNAAAPVFTLSAQQGDGLAAWLEWLQALAAAGKAGALTKEA